VSTILPQQHIPLYIKRVNKDTKQMPTTQLSLQDVQNRYPNGIKKEGYGCYYFVDYDGDLGYFIQLANGSFEDNVQYVDFDTMSDNEREDIMGIYKEIA